MVLQLKTDTTAGSHITLGGAQFLRLPLTITRSWGNDYARGGDMAHSMGRATERMWCAQSPLCSVRKQARRPLAQLPVNRRAPEDRTEGRLYPLTSHARESRRDQIVPDHLPRWKGEARHIWVPPIMSCNTVICSQSSG
jgi:hypothetical protein